MSYHTSECLRRHYLDWKQDELHNVYEFTITFNREKWYLDKLEKKGLEFTCNLFNNPKYEVVQYIMAKEFHEEVDYFHYHGVFTVLKKRDNSKFLKKELGKKLGRTQIDLLRDGLLDNIVKKYHTWFDYIIKDKGNLFYSKKLDCCKQFLNAENFY